MVCAWTDNSLSASMVYERHDDIIYSKYLQWRCRSPFGGLTGDRYHLRHMASNQSRNNFLAFAFRKTSHAASAAGSWARSGLKSRAPRGRLFPIPASSSLTVPPWPGSRPTSCSGSWSDGSGGRAGRVGRGRRWRYADKGRNEDGRRIVPTR